MIEQAVLSFAGLLRQLRAEARLTQEELAEAARLSPRTVSDLERGVNRTAHKDTAGMLADALGLEEPVRRLFVAAARGRAPTMDVLAARRGAPIAADRKLVTPATAEVTIGAGSEVSYRRPVPAQLPHNIPDFTGRDAEIGALMALLPGDDGDVSGTVVITSIAGTAGVGKSALAVYWAYQIRDRFPDGQLYVNLRGFDPGGSPMEPTEAIRRLLDALGVPPDQVSADLDAQAALYRSILAGRRVLILLDNARDTTQVRPLLPGSPTCLVVVTSRNQMISLVAADGAHPVELDLLSAREARRLLSRRLGHHRIAAEPVSVGEIIDACARLPLAISIVTGRAAASPRLPLSALAEELRGAHGGLDALDAGDSHTNIRAVFSWSYRALSTPAARLFRLLGLHAGPDITAAAAASLAGVPLAPARSLLVELTRAYLLTEWVPGRFVFHDLLRAYSSELADAHDPWDDRRAAIHRVLDHYLHTAYRADQLLRPRRDDPIALAPAQPLVSPENFADHRMALAWFKAEHQVLVAALRQAESQGFSVHCWQLPWALTSFFDRCSHWQDAAASHRTALDAAERLGDVRAQAISHGCLAYAYIRLGRYDPAQAHLLQTLRLYEALGDHTGQAHAHRSLGWALDQQGRYREALPHAEQALELFQAAGHQTGQARAFNAIGWFHIQLGNHAEGLHHCRHALELQREIGDRFGQADILHSIAYAHHLLANYEEAAKCYEQALQLYREFGDRYYEADTLASLGDILLAAGDPGSARDAWQRAVTILDDLGHPDVSHVRAKLNKLASTATGRIGNRRSWPARHLDELAADKAR